MSLGPQYLRLASQCREKDMLMQCVMSFHSCGGNVGDDANVPLPRWSSSAADIYNAWFADKNGNDVNREYISIGEDHCIFLPGKHGPRTPIECYRDIISKL